MKMKWKIQLFSGISRKENTCSLKAHEKLFLPEPKNGIRILQIPIPWKKYDNINKMVLYFLWYQLWNTVNETTPYFEI